MSRRAKTLTLTAEEREHLTQIEERGSDWRERRRARTVLLLAEGGSLDGVAKQQKLHKETVANHRDAWLARGFIGLRDLPRSGAPRKLSETYQQVLCAWATAEACTAPPVEGPPVRGTWRTGFGGSGSGGLEREELCLEKDPAQSKKNGMRRNFEQPR